MGTERGHRRWRTRTRERPPTNSTGPQGLHVDEEGAVIVAENVNHRIVEWKRGDTRGRVLAGGNEAGDRPDQLNLPDRCACRQRERQSHHLRLRSNRRVTRWSRRSGTQSGETIIDNIELLGD